MSRRSATGACVLALCAASSLHAQTVDTLGTRGALHVSPFVGVARNSEASGSWGSTPDRDHLFVGVHVAAPVIRVAGLRLSYAPNVIPVVVVRHTPRYGPSFRDFGQRERYWRSGSIIGAGFSPLGLQLGADVTRALELHATGAVGGLWFTRPVPEPGTRRFNYTFEYGAGATWRVRRAHALQLGYKFHHLSNLYTADWNPGLDAHVFYAGLQWRIRVPRE